MTMHFADGEWWLDATEDQESEAIMTAHEGKRTLEDIAAVQAENTMLLQRIAERLDHHTSLLQAIETSIQLLAGNITNMRTELLVIKALVAKEEE